MSSLLHLLTDGSELLEVAALARQKRVTLRGDCVNDLGPVSVLTHREAWPHLPPDLELGSRRDGNHEATFSVDVSGDVGREELATVTRAGV